MNLRIKDKIKNFDGYFERDSRQCIKNFKYYKKANNCKINIFYKSHNAKNKSWKQLIIKSLKITIKSLAQFAFKPAKGIGCCLKLVIRLQ